jgi:hypothetical protein
MGLCRYRPHSNSITDRYIRRIGDQGVVFILSYKLVILRLRVRNAFMYIILLERDAKE